MPSSTGSNPVAKRETRQEAGARLHSTLMMLPDICQAFSSLDPYADGFENTRDATLAACVRDYWPGVRSVFPDMPEDLVLRHAWGEAFSKPLALGVLCSSVRQRGGSRLSALVDDFVRISSTQIAGDPLAMALVWPTRTAPDLAQADGLMPGMRVRYTLAHLLSHETSAHTFVAAACAVKSATVYIKRRELLRMLQEADRRGVRMRRYSETQFLMRSPEEQALVLSGPKLADCVLPSSVARLPDAAKWVASRCQHRDRVEKTAETVFVALSVRNFTAVETSLAPISVDALARAVFAQQSFADAVKSRSADPSRSYSSPSRRRAPAPPKRWAPLSSGAQQLLAAVWPRCAIPRHWSMTATDIASALCAGDLHAHAILPPDLRLLRATWTRREQVDLLRAGLHNLIAATAKAWNDISLTEIITIAAQWPEFAAIIERRMTAGVPPEEILQLLGDQSFVELRTASDIVRRRMKDGSSLAVDVIGHVGTTLWRSAGGWDLHGTNALGRLHQFAKRRQSPVDMDAFVHETTDFLVQALAKAQLAPASQKEPVKSATASSHQMKDTAAAALADRFPAIMRALAKRVPASQLAPIIPSLNSLRSLEILQSDGPAELAHRIFQLRIDKTSSPKKLIGLLVAGARAGWPIPWRPAWLQFARVSPRPTADQTGAAAAQPLNEAGIEALTVLVLALRRRLKKLKAVSASVREEDMRTAMDRAAKALCRVSSGAAALLQLGARIDRSELSYLAAAASDIDRAAKPGARLDAQYLEWTLPKRSGGTRTISAPVPSLKRTQRAILRGLLDPVGAHPCAQGFVKGRSIKSNAALHVGRQVVVNGDVANCFPSVRWPLVLAALRRDFGGDLSPQAISLLVDLCTSRGGLPIGAPTSPALLNRVLLRSDEILTEQAELRGCVYSRYADDLTFSGDHRAVEMLGVARGVLGRIGLTLDPKKTNIFRRGRRQMVTGLVVNQQVSVPRRLRRRLRAATHRASQGLATAWHGQPQSLAALKGRIAFIAMVHPREAANLRAQLDGETGRVDKSSAEVKDATANASSEMQGSGKA